MAFPKYQTKEVLNKVLNSGETALQVDIVAGAEYAEDSGHTSTDTGNFILGVRNDTLAALGGTDGDYVPFQMNADGALYVEISSGGANDSIYVDDADWTDSTSKHTLVGGLYQSSPQTITDGDVGPFQVDADGALHISDGGNAITVDGTVTANLGTTDNAVLDAVAASLAVLDDWDDSNYANVNANIAGTDIVGGAGAVASGVQRVTLASDDPAVTSLGNLDNAVDGNYLNVNMNLAGSDAQAGEGTISATTQRVTIATDDDGVAHLATIAGAVSTQMQVDVVASLPAGSAAIGKLAANSGVDIGDVDVTSVIPGVAATSLGKAIQSAQGGTDTGVAALVVRNDALADLSGADGDYTPLQVNKTGALNVTETTGHLGAIFEDGDTNTTSKQIIAIQFIEDTTFTTLTPVDSSYIGTASGNGDAIDTSNVFPQGMTIFGRWTGYRLASGTVVAYQGSW